MARDSEDKGKTEGYTEGGGRGRSLSEASRGGPDDKLTNAKHTTDGRGVDTDALCRCPQRRHTRGVPGGTGDQAFLFPVVTY